MACYLAKYLGSKDPGLMSPVEINYLKPMFCPGYGKFSTEDPAAAQTRVTYRLTVGYTNGMAHVPNSAVPFGYQGVLPPPSPAQMPVTKLSAVSAYGALTDIYAVSDLDSQIAAGGWQNEAVAPVHGTTRNSLYFDWHVKSFRGTNLSTVVQ